MATLVAAFSMSALFGFGGAVLASVGSVLAVVVAGMIAPDVAAELSTHLDDERRRRPLTWFIW
ncbi:MAG: hypothetical protein HY291_23365 [Planctomycetes bacterium]|nr:hypothetical protein [Planctomycetota bacterium]